jgi:predicted transcriptional regulator
MQKRPTASELEILSVLWSRGPSTVREIHDQLNAGKPTGYTTVLKMLQLMTAKELVRRDEAQRAHVYRARVPQERTQSQLVRELVDKAFAGSAASLVMHALSDKRASAEELAEIRELLDEMEGEAK